MDLYEELLLENVGDLLADVSLVFAISMHLGW